jgi:hypothetical protein
MVVSGLRSVGYAERALARPQPFLWTPRETRKESRRYARRFQGFQTVLSPGLAYREIPRRRQPDLDHARQRDKKTNPTWTEVSRISPHRQGFSPSEDRAPTLTTWWIDESEMSKYNGLLPKQFFVVRQFGSSRLALRSRLSDVRLTTKR